jgi:hypothetical protein
VQAIWAELKGHLEQRVTQLNEEISRYPTPIARCDDQLGALLEQRAALFGRLKQMNEFAGGARKRQNHVHLMQSLFGLPSDAADPEELRLQARLKHQLSKQPR